MELTFQGEKERHPSFKQRVDRWIGKIYITCDECYEGASLVAWMVESAYNAGDLGSAPGLGRSPGGGYGDPLQYSCLENPMDRGAGGLQSIVLQRVRHN